MEDRPSDCPCKKQRVSDSEPDTKGYETERKESENDGDKTANSDLLPPDFTSNVTPNSDPLPNLEPDNVPNSDILPNLESESEDNGISMCSRGLLDCLTEVSSVNDSQYIDSDTGEIIVKPDVTLPETKPERKVYPSERVRHDIAGERVRHDIAGERVRHDIAGERVRHDIAGVVQDTMAALAENTYIRNKEASMLALNCSSSMSIVGQASLSNVNARSNVKVTRTCETNTVSDSIDSVSVASFRNEGERNEQIGLKRDNTSYLRRNKAKDRIQQSYYDVKKDVNDSAEPGPSYKLDDDHSGDSNVIDHCDNDDCDDDEDDDVSIQEKSDFLSDSGFISLFTNCRNPSTSHVTQTESLDRIHGDSNNVISMDRLRGVGDMNASGDASAIPHSVPCTSSESSTFGDLKMKSLILDSFFKYIPCGISGKQEVSCRPSNTPFQLDNDYIHKVMNQNNINSLPPQLLVLVFRYLSLYTLLRKVSLVCKYWYNWCRDQDLWKNINLMNQHRLTDVHLQQLVSFSDRVVSVNLTDCRFVTNVGVKMLLARCVHLQMLKLMRCFDLSDEAFKDICDRHLCSQLRCLRLDGCCKITDATIVKVAKACPNLQILHVNQCTKITDISIMILADRCPRLTQLLMDHCSQVTEKGLEAIVEGCPYMTYLNIMSCGVTDRGVKLLSKLTNLTNVDLSNIPRLTPDAIVYLSRHCKNLECINISLNSVMNDECVTELARNLPKLKRLYCVSCNISDTGLEKIAQYRPSLEALDVGWCQDITDHGVCVISESCPHLDYFGLIRCDQVSIEKVEELLLRFPRVNYSTFVLESRRILERAQREGFMFGLPAEKS